MHVPSNFRVVCSFAFAVTACSSDGEGNGMNHPGGGGGTSGATTPTSTPIAPIAFDALYVVNGGDATISVIDTGRNEVARTIALRGAQYPHHVYFNSDRSQLALAIPGMDLSAGHTGPGSGEMPGFVQLLNASDGSTLSARQLGAMNHNGVFSPVGNEVWTSQMKSPGDVLVLDATSLQEKARILVQNAPAEVTFSANGKYGFVANSGSASVTIIDVTSKQIVKTIAVEAGPVGAWQGSNGIAYVDNEQAETITAIDTNTLEATHTYSLGFMPGMVAFGPDGRLWVTDAENGKVVFNMPDMDMKTGELATGAGAHGLAFSGDGKTAYVSNQAAASVTAIDVASSSVVKNITVGSKPNGLLWRAR